MKKTKIFWVLLALIFVGCIVYFVSGRVNNVSEMNIGNDIGAFMIGTGFIGMLIYMIRRFEKW